MMSEPDKSDVTLFNSALETGVRALVILVANFPAALDLQRLVDFDYLVVHSGDVDGPESLHPPLPMLSARTLRHRFARRNRQRNRAGRPSLRRSPTRKRPPRSAPCSRRRRRVCARARTGPARNPTVGLTVGPAPATIRPRTSRTWAAIRRQPTLAQSASTVGLIRGSAVTVDRLQSRMMAAAPETRAARDRPGG